MYLKVDYKILPNLSVRIFKLKLNKININKYIQDVIHPIPKIDELFVGCTSRRRKIYKLRFFQCMYQLEVTEDTKKHLSWSTHRGIYQLILYICR